MENITTYNNIAVLIDADNTELGKMKSLIDKVSTYGRITTKRVYGNWKKTSLKNWEEVIKNLAFNAQQQFDYVKGKNVTDIALVIDAMELLHTGRYDAFVIVSSDSDYTPLNIKLRETGIFVVGAGKQTSSDSFKRSCDDFINIETLADEQARAEDIIVPQKDEITNEESSEPISEEEMDLHRLLKDGTEVEHWLDEDGFVNIASVGQYIKRVRPDFDIKKFGVEKLPEFIALHSERYEMKNSKKGRVTIRSYRLKKGSI